MKISEKEQGWIILFEGVKANNDHSFLDYSGESLCGNYNHPRSLITMFFSPHQSVP